MNNEITSQEKAELLERISSARATLDQAIAALSEPQLAAPGPDGGWSVKDHLAHLTAWEHKLLAMIQGQPGYLGLQIDAATYASSNLDELNAILHARFQSLGAAAALDEARQSYRQLVAGIEALPAAALSGRYAPADDPEDARRVIDGIANNTYEHYDEHRAAIEQIVASL
jgi:uncharacterized protein (TIGR03083 family)